MVNISAKLPLKNYDSFTNDGNRCPFVVVDVGTGLAYPAFYKGAVGNESDRLRIDHDFDDAENLRLYQVDWKDGQTYEPVARVTGNFGITVT